MSPAGPNCRKPIAVLHISKYVHPMTSQSIVVSRHKMFFYQLAFALWKMFIRPFKRGRMRWCAIIFNEGGQFAIDVSDGGRQQLPSGVVRPGYPIPHLCERGLKIERSEFRAPLRLVGASGRWKEEVIFYYSAEVISNVVSSKRYLFVDRSQLSSLVPEEIVSHLNSNFTS